MKMVDLHIILQTRRAGRGHDVMEYSQPCIVLQRDAGAVN